MNLCNIKSPTDTSRRQLRIDLSRTAIEQKQHSNRKRTKFLVFSDRRDGVAIHPYQAYEQNKTLGGQLNIVRLHQLENLI